MAVARLLAVAGRLAVARRFARAPGLARAPPASRWPGTRGAGLASTRAVRRTLGIRGARGRLPLPLRRLALGAHGGLTVADCVPRGLGRLLLGFFFDRPSPVPYTCPFTRTVARKDF